MFKPSGIPDGTEDTQNDLENKNHYNLETHHHFDFTSLDSWFHRVQHNLAFGSFII